MQKNKQPKHSFKHTLSNNFWILKFVVKYAPTLLWEKLIRIPILIFSTYMSVNLTYWILGSIEAGNELSSVILLILGIFLFLLLANAFLAFFGCIINPQKEINLSANIRKDIIHKIKNIDQINFQIPSFFDTYTLALNEVDRRAIDVLNTLTAATSSLLTFYLLTGVTLNVSPVFALFGVAAVLIDLCLGVVRQKLNYNQTIETTPDSRKRGYVGRVTYQPEFSPDLKIYPEQSDLIIHKYKKATSSVKTILLKYAKKIFLIDQSQQIPGLILRQILPWIMIAIMLFNKTITIPEGTLLAASALTLPNTLSSFATNFSSLYTHSLFIENLRKIFGYKENIEVPRTDKQEIAEIKNIALDNISFAYAENSPVVLRNISLNIGKGEKIAIVGYNGAGKSTLAKLLIRLFEPLGGHIKVNDNPIEDFDVKALRAKIAYLSQDFKIYGFTIAENVFMRPVENDEDKETARAILEKVGLGEKIKNFSRGVDTYITREFEENGEYLSGGEMQKLSLARLYAGNYDCIIMDESTSALDPVSEDEIIHTIFELFKEKTIIMISHRLSTIKNVGTVIFMENGEIKEHGSHNALMEQDSAYAKFYAIQASKYD